MGVPQTKNNNAKGLSNILCLTFHYIGGGIIGIPPGLLADPVKPRRGIILGI